jgi:hypothetical protein
MQSQFLQGEQGLKPQTLAASSQFLPPWPEFMDFPIKNQIPIRSFALFAVKFATG